MMTSPITLLATFAASLRYRRALARRAALRNLVCRGRYGQPDPKCPHCVAIGLVDGESVEAGREALAETAGEREAEPCQP